MSAFLYFSQDKRRKIKDSNPSIRNTEVSRILGEMWRSASEEERRPHIEREKKEREKYKVAIAEWREEYEKKMEEQRKRAAEQASFATANYNTPTVEQQPIDRRAPQYSQQQQYESPQHHAYQYPPPQHYGYGGGHRYPMYCKFVCVEDYSGSRRLTLFTQLHIRPTRRVNMGMRMGSTLPSWRRMVCLITHP